MAKKRGNGEGSISQRPNGTWQGQISLSRDDNGKLKRATFYGKTRREVAEKIKQALGEQQKGTFIEPSKVLFEKYRLLWLETKVNAVSENTYNKYESYSRIHLKPEFETKELQKITRADIQDFINKKSETLSPKTVVELHMIMSNIFELAIEDKILYKSPCKKIGLPQIVPPKIRILNEDEMTAILKACCNTRIYDVVFLEYSTGLRRSEILGLSWDDFDENNNTLSINKAWIYCKGKPQWNDTENGTKSAAGNRIIPIHTSVTEFLKKRRESHKNDIYIFQSTNSLPYNPNNFYRDYKKHVKKAETTINKEREKQELPPVSLDIDFHDLRHNYGTKLAALGIHQRIIEAQMGHIDYRSSRRYIHATQSGQHEAAQKIGEALNNVLTATTAANNSKPENEPVIDKTTQILDAEKIEQLQNYEHSGLLQ